MLKRKVTYDFVIDYLRIINKGRSGELFAQYDQYTDALDWAVFLEYGKRMSVSLYSEIKNTGIAKKIPHKILNALNLKYLSALCRNGKSKITIADMAQRFNDDGIDHVFLKGAAMIFTIYTGKAAARPMEDIDVLVHKKDLERAENVLREMGFSEDYKRVSRMFGRHADRDSFTNNNYHYIYFRDTECIELHWEIGFRKAPEGLYSMVSAIEERNAEIKIFSPEAALFVICSNMLKDQDFIKTEERLFSSGTGKDKLFYKSMDYFMEIGMMLDHYADNFLWSRFFELARSDKRFFTIGSLLMICGKISGRIFPEEFYKYNNRNIFSKIFTYFLKRVPDKDYLRIIFFARILARVEDLGSLDELRLKQVLMEIYLAAMTYFDAYKPSLYRILRKIENGIRVFNGKEAL